MGGSWSSTVVSAMMVSSSESFLLYSSTAGKCSTMAVAPTAVATAVADTAHPPAPPPKPVPGGDLLSLNFDELSQILGGSGRAKMVWSALSAGVDPFGDAAEFLTDKTAAVLKDTVERLPWQVVRESVSSCGTRKLLVQLEDGLEVETVVIPDLSGSRSTVCVSSQIGCAKNCQFCMTGKMGLVRNLTAGEILGQVFFARETVREHGMPPLTNAVYMGMGEPLDNPGAVTQSLQVLTHPFAFAMAKSKISVSTVGPSPAAIRRMKGMPSRLAWSVHAATDDVRRLLVPTTVHSMAELRDAFAEVLQSRRREHLFVEVVLIEGMNDSPELARALASLLRPLPIRAGINLLPYNDTGHPFFRASPKESVEEFQRVLTQEGFVATIRTARGDEESSACGQLATTANNERALKQRHRRSTDDDKAAARPP
ncbi:conserved unknown protein [Ectocarpus siliculosus]|uniref:Radical SAM core domain-containing protein n=1 Tax=Ectocarpus siliculosus TaxID=2880 RepID=D7FQQ6_ECTSI|nr:conserved unknown protein [Ectocarpus siliculosus]|eukprot:CBJ49163.1 conserved unknown protein [Ectocarpus siliculosus]